MGYTHYIKAKRTVSKTALKKITADVKVIEQYMESIGQPLFDGSGETKGVEYDKDSIQFNGDESKGESHETFCITNWVSGGDFCKTARKPYDLAVVMTLLSIREHCPTSSIVISTDGDMEDWKEAIDTFNKLFPNVQGTYMFGGRYNDTLFYKKFKSQ
jgi:hypothetical protein|tara:strand:- start:871 stop:1344 length:474 start_codon:yes stop_codon:yes gene_type:complete